MSNSPVTVTADFNHSLTGHGNNGFVQSMYEGGGIHHGDSAFPEFLIQQIRMLDAEVFKYKQVAIYLTMVAFLLTISTIFSTATLGGQYFAGAAVIPLGMSIRELCLSNFPWFKLHVNRSSYRN